MSTARKKGNFAIVRGGLYARRPGRRTRTAEEWRLDRELMSAFAAIHGEDGTVPSKGIYHIREGVQHPWRVLARRFIEARQAGAPKDQLKAVLNVMALWIDDTLYNDRQPDRAA